MSTPPRPELADLRQEYKRAQLDEGNVAADPIAQFRSWFEEAQKAELAEPHAMTLAREMDDGIILVNLSGRGDKDVQSVREALV